MTHMRKILLGIASWLPLASLTLFYVWWTRAADSEAMFEASPAPVIGFAVAMLLGLVLVLFFVLRVVREPAMHGTRKLAWVIALSVAGVLALPAYWYLHVWQSPGSAP